MQNDKLLPCPFCGGDAEIRKGFHELDNWVQCLNCSSAIGSHTTKETAIKKWNTRKPMERIVEQLEDKMLTSESGKAEANIGMLGSLANFYVGESRAYRDAIKIVKGGVDNAG